VRLGLAAQLRHADPNPLTDTVTEAVSDLETQINTLRALITDLRPAALDDMGTEAAIEDLAERARSRGLAVDLTADLSYEHGRASERHTVELETAMYRIVQEALTNAVRHSGARHASIEIQEDDNAVRVTVRDDGRGFDTTTKADGFGLLGMRERAELLEGRSSRVRARQDHDQGDVPSTAPKRTRRLKTDRAGVGAATDSSWRPAQGAGHTTTPRQGDKRLCSLDASSPKPEGTRGSSRNRHRQEQQRHLRIPRSDQTSGREARERDLLQARPARHPPCQPAGESDGHVPQ
jgi:two-component sensor histidine kinase